MNIVHHHFAEGDRVRAVKALHGRLTKGDAGIVDGVNRYGANYEYAVEPFGAWFEEDVWELVQACNDDSLRELDTIREVDMGDWDDEEDEDD